MFGTTHLRCSGLGLLVSILLIVSSPTPTTADPSAIHVAPIYSENEPLAPFVGLLPFTTKTVYGFLDFITTVGNTVMVFTPKGGKGQRSPVEASKAIVATTPSLKINIESTVALELESLFQNLEKTRDPAPFIEIQSSQQEPTSRRIKPTSVKSKNIIQKNRVKLQDQADDFVYDKFSTEPALIVEETFKVKSAVVSPTFTGDNIPDTIRDDFFGGAGGGVFPTGVVTTTAYTQIVNGLTTIRSTEVFGTFLDGEYAQVVQSTAKVFQAGEGNDGGFAGSVHITELPQFGLEAKGVSSVEVIAKPSNPIKDKIKSRIRINSNRRSSAISSFKERLKNRYQKYRETAPGPGPSAERRTFTPSSKPRNFDVTGETGDVFIINGAAQTTTSTSFRGSRTSSRLRERSRGRSLEPEELDNFEKPEEAVTPKPVRKSGRSTGGFGSRHRSRTSRPRPSFNRKKESFSRSKIVEVEKRNRGSSKRFQPERLSSRTEAVVASSVGFIKPTASSKFRPNRFSSTSKIINKPNIQIKTFNRFSRPNIRKDLLNKFLKKRPENENNVDPTKTTKTEENQDEDDLAFSGDHDTSPSALVPSIVDDEDALQNLEIDDETRLKRLQTTLLVSTVYPSEASDEYLEIATIRSPYTFAIEDSLKSTRFITVTRTESKTIESTVAPSSTFIKPSSVSDAPKGTPLFHTDSIPAPENILAASTTQRYNEIIQGTQDIETLPAITLPPQASGELPPFKTVAETFSTEDVMIKRSILPIVQGSETSYYTLSQYYTVTRLVTALKTIPPMELYEFSPSKAFTDFDQLFEGAGSEKRYEQLLPGELEFSDQDDFEHEGPTPIRVAPPPGFKEDLDLIGAKLDFVENMEKDNNPGIVQLKKQPSLQSSFRKPVPHLANFNEIKPTRTQATPFLPDSSLQQNGLLGTLGLTPEQLLYLQILQNPLAALGLGGAGLGGEVVTETKPIYRTEIAYETDTIKLFYGASSFFSTLTRSVGMTTITDYEYATKTVGNALGRLPFAGNTHNKNVIDESPLAALPFGGFGIQPAVTVITDTITRNTVVPSIFEESYRIRFRNEFVFTTITSTTMVSTQLTKYVTQTKRVSPF